MDRQVVVVFPRSGPILTFFFSPHFIKSFIYPPNSSTRLLNWSRSQTTSLSSSKIFWGAGYALCAIAIFVGGWSSGTLSSSSQRGFYGCVQRTPPPIRFLFVPFGSEKKRGSECVRALDPARRRPRVTSSLCVSTGVSIQVAVRRRASL